MKTDEWAALYAPLLTDPVPRAVSDHLARLSVDTIAIAHHARAEQIGAAAFDADFAGDGPCTVWGGGTGSAEGAAFLNGTAAEALDFQEVLIDGRNNGHAAVVIVPAVLAVAEARGVEGERICRALWIAFAANIALARTLGRGHREGEVGFRTTSLTAPVAAALGLGYLLSDDPAIAGHATAICAASLPAGLLAAMSPDAGDFSVDKDLSVGFSARHAVSCALLAEKGATGPSTALVGARSWLASYGFDTVEIEHLWMDPLDADISAYALKLFPANFGCQCAIQMAIGMSRELAVEDIEKVVLRVKTSSASSLSTRDLTTHVAARFSLVYAVASAFLRGRSVLSDFDESAFRDQRIHDFMPRIELVADQSLEDRHRSEGVFPAAMRVTMRDGTVHEAELSSPDEGLDNAARQSILDDKIGDLCPAPVAAALKRFRDPDPAAFDRLATLTLATEIPQEGETV